MPLFLPEDVDYFTDRGNEFFAWLPVKTTTGWAIWTDCVEIWDWDRERGWRMHFEKLYSGG